MKRKYEWIMIAVAMLAFASWFYKEKAFDSAWRETKELQRSIKEIQETVALKALWHVDRHALALERLRKAGGGAESWDIEGKKVKARYEKLDAKQLDVLLTLLMRMPLQIVRLDISYDRNHYRVEFVCKYS